jgi:predicted nucleic acid-binding protein
VIVVDTNIIAYLLLPGDWTAMAEKAARKDVWCAPLLWRSEFRNVLALYLRRRTISFEDAVRQMEAAERLLRGREYAVTSSAVLELVRRSNRSAYDCEFVALAGDLGIRLVTTDEPVVKEFPRVAVHLRDYVGAR